MSKRVKLSALAVALLSALAVSLLFGMSRGSDQSLKQQRLRDARMLLKGADAPGRIERSQKTKGLENGREASRSEIANGPAQEDYDNRAYPSTRIAYTQVQAALRAAKRLAKKPKPPKPPKGWVGVGPKTLNVDTFGTQTYGVDTQWSGRVTALATGPTCTKAKNKCTLYVGAAGGGIWKTDNALDNNPGWTQISDGWLDTNSIGSILVDPTDPSGKRIYAGTGEPNGSGDSEAGIGLYKSTDGGKTWFLLPASVPYTKDRAIGAIAVDPTNPQHILIGTDVARHGLSSDSGGRFTPPDAPTIGLYESTNGGATWALAFNQPQDAVDPTSVNGSDFFTGGVTKIQYDPNSPSQYYFSMFGYGVFRYDGGFENIFYDDESPVSDAIDVVRFEFTAVNTGEFPAAPIHKGKVALCTKLYVGAGWNEGGPHDASRLYTNDCVNAFAAGDLTTGGTNGGWNDMSSSDETDPGYGSFDFCQAQCSYDILVESPPGQPNTVYLGGSMQYGELPLYGGPDISNGRAVVRSTDGGNTWTDMTGDATFRPGGLIFDWEDMHPDQHALVFAPGTPDIFFAGSDGGVIRSSGGYTNNSNDCNNFSHRFIGSQEEYDNCLQFLSNIPKKLITMNAGLNTLQFQSLSLAETNPLSILMGGTQDNGTLAYSGSPTWFLGITGDGGDSTINVANSNTRTHTYTNTFTDTNFHGATPETWVWTGDGMYFSGEASAFYAPMIADPTVPGRIFAGMEHVWRTNDSGGSQAFLEAHCNTTFAFGTSDLVFTGACGDWEALGAHLMEDSYYGSDKGADDPGNYVAALARGMDNKTLYVGTRRGRIFISKNADANVPGNVLFYRIDDSDQPTRYPSGIFVDPNNPYHLWITYSSYNAYADIAGTADGHIFEVTVNPNACTATHCASTWTNRDYDIGDQPVLDVAYYACNGSLYVSTDYGVLRLDWGGGPSWIQAAGGLPMAAAYGLTLSEGGHVLYAATHGRGAYQLMLPTGCV